MSGFVSKLQKLSPKKSRERIDTIEKGFEEPNKESYQHFNKQPHKPLGRLSHNSSTLPPHLSKSGVSSRTHSQSDVFHAYTDIEDETMEDNSLRRFSDRSQKPPIMTKPRRPGKLDSIEKAQSMDTSLSDSGSVCSLPSVQTLSQRYMPGRRFSETSADSDVFDSPSPRPKHKTMEADKMSVKSVDLSDYPNQNSPLTSTGVHGLDWKSKPTEYWTTEDVVAWSWSLGIDKLPKIFQNAGITGTHLVNITDEILVELGLRSMVDRRKFLAEVKGLCNRKMSSLWSIKQVSMKRRNLERSTEQLYANLESLQKLNEEQEKKISSSLHEIQQEQLEAKELLSRERIQHADNIESSLGQSKKLSDWSTNEAVQWLENNNLAQFVSVFLENQICGKDLDDNDLKFLDYLGGFESVSMEALLSAIYRLQNPEPLSNQENDLEKIQTEEDRQKYIAALQVAALEGSFSGSVMSGSTGTLNSSLTDSTNTLYTRHLGGSRDNLGCSTDCLGGSADTLSVESSNLANCDTGEDQQHSKHTIQRSSPRRTNVYRKNHSVSPDVVTPRPKSAPVSRESSTKLSVHSPYPSLFNTLNTDKPVTLVCVKISVPAEQLGFKVNVTEKGKVIVTQTLKNAIPLRKGDRILEACGTSLGLVETEEEFMAVIKDRFLLNLVVQREEPDRSSTIKSPGTNNDEVIVLKNKLTQSENSWLELKTILEELKDMDVGSEEYLKLFPIAKVESVKDTYKLEEQLQQLQRTLTNQVTRANTLESELDTKERSLKQSEEEREIAQTKLHQLISIIDTDNKGLPRDELDDTLPLWENLRSADKEDVLQALKDNILESTRQKAYLDHLLGIVIDQAPYLLDELEDMEVPEEGAQRMVTRNIPEEWC